MVLGSATNVGATRLPTEAELARQHSVSRQTVRRAYYELVSDGLVVRYRGRGTFPVVPMPYVRTFGTVDDLLAQSADTEMEILSPLRGPMRATRHIAASLRVTKLMQMSLRRFHGGLPFSIVLLYFPPDIGEQLAHVPEMPQLGERRPLTVLELLDRALEHPAVSAKQTIRVARIPTRLAKLIDCSPNETVLRIDRIFVDDTDRPIELTVNFFHPDRYSYKLDLRRVGRTPAPSGSAKITRLEASTNLA
jgi:GntR family transcriptional regulator